jgi:beta-glucosidase
VVQAWYPGQEGGTAIAEVLLGRVSPSGKLPVTMPRSVGQIPMSARLRPSSHRGYLFTSSEPLFPFGHGLSYTSFHYEALTLEPEEIAIGETVKVMVDVTNTGDRDGAEEVQCYVTDLVACVTRPRKSLRGFCRVELKAGETGRIQFDLGERDFALVDREMRWRVEPGEFRISVGGSSKTSPQRLLTVR